MKNRYLYILIVAFTSMLSSCVKENVQLGEAEVVKAWTIGLAAANMLPGVDNRPDTANVNFQLLSDNSIRYEMTTGLLTNDDVLSGVQLRSGDPVTIGNVVLDLSATSKYPQANALGGGAYGVYTDLRQSLVDSLMNNSNDLYLQLNSVQRPNGLARGQINVRMQFAADVNLNGAQEVPAVNTKAVGITWLRLTLDNRLYSRINISGNEANDDFTMAHIHRGAFGENGPVIVPLALSNADFGVSKMTVVDASTSNTIANGSKLYVNAHSVLYPAGKIRGQLRN